MKRLLSLITNIPKNTALLKKNRYKIREVDSVQVHENEALVKGNKKEKKRNNTFRKQNITSLASLEWTWYGSI